MSVIQEETIIEKWKSVVGHENMFEVSDLGNVRSKTYTIMQKNGRRRTFFSRSIKPIPQKKPHYRPVVNLHQSFYSVESLVASAFVDNPNRLEKIGHRNRDVQDNRSSNLYWKDKDEMFLKKEERLAFSKDKILQSQIDEIVTPCDVCGTHVVLMPGQLNNKLRKNKYGVCCSIKCSSVITPREEREKRGLESRGEKSPNWRGGSKTDAAFRRSSFYLDWVKAVLNRDNYTCFFCGCRGGKLQADHIKTFVDNPELRLELSNGRTVCEDCHRKTPTYGIRGKLGFVKKMKNKVAKRLIIDLSFKHKLSHLGSNLGAVDVIIKMLKKKKPNEKFFLSAGHYGIAYYAALETLYGHNAEHLFLKHGTHCGKDLENEIWCVNGSLGCVVSIALGAAMADRTKDVYCLLSDGELAEGSTSEAIRFKAAQKLDNLKIYVNANGLGAYSVIDVEKAMKATLSVDRSIQFCYTTPNQMPFLNGLDAHYHVMNEADYKAALEVLA